MLLDVAVCLPRDAETVPIVRAVVHNALLVLGVVAECVDDVCLALSEACTNVIDHAVPADEYEVRFEVDETQCAITVTNTGEGFDAAELDGVMPTPASARGRGVAIMRAVMDSVAFTPDGSEPGGGTIVHLVKALSVEPDGPLARLGAKRRGRSEATGPAA